MAAGEELLDLGQDPVRIAEPGQVVGAVDLEVPRARDVVGEVPTALHRNDVVAGVDDQGGHGDRRQDRPDVDPEPRFEIRPHHSRARAHALEHCSAEGRAAARAEETRRELAAIDWDDDDPLGAGANTSAAS